VATLTDHLEGLPERRPDIRVRPAPLLTLDRACAALNSCEWERLLTLYVASGNLGTFLNHLNADYRAKATAIGPRPRRRRRRGRVAVRARAAGPHTPRTDLMTSRPYRPTYRGLAAGTLAVAALGTLALALAIVPGCASISAGQ
jgi:hypothetical protein